MARRFGLCSVVIVLLVIVGCGGPSGDASKPAPPAVASSPPASRPRAPVDDRFKVNVDDVLNAKESSSASKAAESGKDEAASDASGSLRQWHNAAGQVVARGEFVSLLSGKVCLQTADGLGTTIALDELSEADQEYVRGQSGGQPAEEPVEVEEASPSATDTSSDDHPSGPVGDHPSGPAMDQTLAAGAAPASYGSSGRRKVVIPFDFESKFDDGRYGSMVGDMFWKKLQREGGFLIPGAMVDVRDLCAANHVKIGPETPLSEVKKVVRDYFDADIAIWGSVERAPGQEWDIYDLVIKCADFTSGPEPQMIYEVAAQTKVVSEIPHLYGKQLLDKLYEREPPRGHPGLDALAEENWKNNPNLVVGDFETGTGGVPKGWSPVGGQQREPLGRQVSWVRDTDDPGNKVIRLTFDKGVGNSYGVMYYSDWFPVDEGAKYRFQCRWRTNGPAAKVFIKCYAEMPSEYRQASAGSASDYHPGAGGYVPEEMQRRECYRSQQNLKGPKNTWNTQTEDFTPTHTKYVPKWGRVMLYGYLGAGVVEFDDVVVKQIIPASPGEANENPRHSMESTVTIEEMRQNEERGREAREKMRQQSTGEQ